MGLQSIYVIDQNPALDMTNDDPQIELKLHLMHPYIIVNHDVLLDLFLFLLPKH